MRVFARKRKKGLVWYIDYTYKGKRYKEAIGPDKKEAQLALEKRRVEIHEGKFYPEARRSKVRFGEFADEYMEKHSRRTKQSWSRDEISLKNLRRVFGGMYLDTITPRMIEDYRLRREKDGAKPATINREHALLKNMFTKAIHWEKVKDNPAKKVSLAKEEERVRFLGTEEIVRLIEAAESDKAPHLKPIIITAVNTGMRFGEIRNLRWEDIDFERRVIKVKKTKNDRPREVPMTDWLVETLQDWRKKRLDFGYVFSNINNDEPITSIKTAFAVALKKAGIKDFRFHDLRHTAASQMYMAGLDIKFIKEIGGWKTLKMVDRYSHISTESKRAGMLIFESHIRPVIGPKMAPFVESEP